MKTKVNFHQLPLKTTIRIFVLLAFFPMLSFTYSCSAPDDDIAIVQPVGLVKLREISNSTHTIELYSKSGKLEQGYNAISIRIKNTATGQYEKNAAVTLVSAHAYGNDDAQLPSLFSYKISRSRFLL